MSVSADDMAQPEEARDDPARDGPPTNTNTGNVHACRKILKISLIALY